jgi:hypothetical protein
VALRHRGPTANTWLSDTAASFADWRSSQRNDRSPAYVFNAVNILSRHGKGNGKPWFIAFDRRLANWMNWCEGGHAYDYKEKKD